MKITDRFILWRWLAVLPIFAVLALISLILAAIAQVGSWAEEYCGKWAANMSAIDQLMNWAKRQQPRKDA